MRLRSSRFGQLTFTSTATTQAGASANSAAAVRVVLDPAAPDARHDAGAGGLEGREFVPEPRRDARALQPDGVQHAPGHRADARARVARPGKGREGLDDDGAYGREVEIGAELGAVTGRAGRRSSPETGGRRSPPKSRGRPPQEPRGASRQHAGGLSHRRRGPVADRAPPPGGPHRCASPSRTTTSPARTVWRTLPVSRRPA